MKSRRITKEIREFYAECPRCKTEVKGSSESMVKGNMEIHKTSKKCKRVKS